MSVGDDGDWEGPSISSVGEGFELGPSVDVVVRAHPAIRQGRVPESSNGWRVDCAVSGTILAAASCIGRHVLEPDL
jgi:hypothetical protein